MSAPSSQKIIQQTNPPSRFVHEKSENFGSDKQRRLRGCDRPRVGAVPRNLSNLRSN